MKHNQVRQVVFPIITAMIWGSSFVAQSASTEHVGAYTFNAARSFVGFLALLVVVQIFKMLRKEPPAEQTAAEKKAAQRGQKRSCGGNQRYTYRQRVVKYLGRCDAQQQIPQHTAAHGGNKAQDHNAQQIHLPPKRRHGAGQGKGHGTHHLHTQQDQFVH